MKTAARRPTPPGATLRDMLDERGHTQVWLAEKLGVAPELVSALVRGIRPITLRRALQLERVFRGVPAEFWLAREITYRLALARGRASAWRLVP